MPAMLHRNFINITMQVVIAKTHVFDFLARSHDRGQSLGSGSVQTGSLPPDLAETSFDLNLD